MKDWMPVLVERQIDGMPEKRKRMAVIICSQMLPRIGWTHGLTSEEMPKLAAGADFALTQESHGRLRSQATFFPKLALGSGEGRFTRLNGPLHKLLSGRRMSEGKNLHVASMRSVNDGTDFVHFFATWSDSTNEREG
ncbi:hypothetical protein FHT29_005987 [Rhizobium sp. SG741]|nr:hypothetical protein [Rhizobium sp. SG741]